MDYGQVYSNAIQRPVDESPDHLEDILSFLEWEDTRNYTGSGNAVIRDPHQTHPLSSDCLTSGINQRMDASQCTLPVEINAYSSISQYTRDIIYDKLISPDVCQGSGFSLDNLLLSTCMDEPGLSNLKTTSYPDVSRKREARAVKRKRVSPAFECTVDRPKRKRDVSHAHAYADNMYFRVPVHNG